jgi:hypothetical protein
MKEIYASHITDPSLKELEEFASWYNEKLGNHPVIVGGWAVYCYTKGLGSKDIDVVFLGDKTKHVTLSAYFLSHGFAERTRNLFDKEFVKPIKSGESVVEIIIDAVSSNRFITFEGRDARIPWSWAVKHNVEHKIGKSIIYIPTIELLLTYKLGAILGRNLYVKTGIDVNYYRSKLWKDVHDVVSLSELEIDSEKYNRFMKDSGLSQYKEEISQIIEDNFDDEIKSIFKEDSASRIKEILIETNI